MCIIDHNKKTLQFVVQFLSNAKEKKEKLRKVSKKVAPVKKPARQGKNRVHFVSHGSYFFVCCSFFHLSNQHFVCFARADHLTQIRVCEEHRVRRDGRTFGSV
jgi:hypothetical protein